MVYEDMRPLIEDFEKMREKSSFCSLSMGKENISWDKCFTTGEFPLAFIFYIDHSLDKMNGLIDRFIKPFTKLDDTYTLHFRKELKDYLGDFNSRIAAIGELLIADHLLRLEEEIVDLEAWNESCGSDIRSRKGVEEYFTEVKYLGEIPELTNQVGHKVVSAGFVCPDILKLYTYINMRIVDAIIQLNKKFATNRTKKRCYILLKSSITSCNTIMQGIRNKHDWDAQKLIELCKTLKEPKEKYNQKNIADWQNEIDCLVIGHLDKSYIIHEQLCLNDLSSPN